MSRIEDIKLRFNKKYMEYDSDGKPITKGRIDRMLSDISWLIEAIDECNRDLDRQLNQATDLIIKILLEITQLREENEDLKKEKEEKENKNG